MEEYYRVHYILNKHLCRMYFISHDEEFMFEKYRRVENDIKYMHQLKPNMCPLRPDYHLRIVPLQKITSLDLKISLESDSKKQRLKNRIFTYK